MKGFQNKFRIFVFIILIFSVIAVFNAGIIWFNSDTVYSENVSTHDKSIENESPKTLYSAVSVKYIVDDVPINSKAPKATEILPEKESDKSVISDVVSENNSSGNESSEIVPENNSSVNEFYEIVPENNSPDNELVEINPEKDLFYAENVSSEFIPYNEFTELQQDSLYSEEDNYSPESYGYILDVPFISQNGLYPTGCESVATVMALNYWEFDITVDEFINSYLDIAENPHKDNGIITGESPWNCFIGSPYSNSGFGCYSTVIENSLYKFVDTDYYSISRLNGVSLNTLCEDYVKNNIPVIIWATAEMTKAYKSDTWITFDGEYYTWIAPEHCLLLTGFDNDYYYFNDPRQGKNVAYIKSEVEFAYDSLYSQAVVISGY